MSPRSSTQVAIQPPEASTKNFDEVFRAELQEIIRRRQTVGLDAATLEDDGDGPTAGLGLVGLAHSGGGIRSAAFSLGVVQELASHGVFRRVDYVSTVSGGGYLGSALSSLLAKPGDDPGSDAASFPLRKELGAEEPPSLRHLRNGSNYLKPGGFLGKLRLPTVVLRGIILNVFFILPGVFIAVFLTALGAELELDDRVINALGRLLPINLSGVFWVAPLVLMLGAFVALVLFFPFRERFRRKRAGGWRGRNTYELVLTVSFVLLVAVLVLIPLLRLVDLAVESTWEGFTGAIANSPINPIKYGQLGWLTAVGVLIALVIAGKISAPVKGLYRFVATLLLRLIGPATLFGAYLLLCLWQITPSFDIRNLPDSTIASAIRELNRGEFPEQLDSAFEAHGETLQRVPGRIGLDAPRILFGRVGLNARPILIGLTVEKIVEDVRWNVSSTMPQDSTLIDRALYAIVGREYFVSVGSLGGDSVGDNGVVVPVVHRFLHVSPPLVDRGLGVFLLVGLVLVLINIFLLDVNITSPHGFYRDRLSRVFLIRQRDGAVASNDEQMLSDLNEKGSQAPYHLINATLNLKGSSDPNLRGRNADFFVFSKHFVGSEMTGWCGTKEMEASDRHVDLGTAMAISAAAAAPNMGTATMGQLTFLMTLFNVRLGYWLPNPRVVNERWFRWHKRVFQGPGPSYLVKEALGSTDARSTYVNVSDGGHLENLGVYQLLRRRCAVIIATDAEADPDMKFKSLAALIRYARIDLGVRIDIKVEPLRRRNADGESRAHWVVGTIHYGEGQTGKLVYIKSSMTGDEPEDLIQYRNQNSAFPHESTADQFFDETQFEVYRTLGEHITRKAFESESAIDVLNKLAT